MPELFDAIKQRRSIRKLQQNPVSNKLVVKVLEAAGWAPSAHNSQPWRFIVISSAEVKRTLAEAIVEAWAEDLKRDGVVIEENTRKERLDRYTNAPVLILACSTMEGLRKYPDQQRQSFERDLAIQSLGASLQNLLLTAHKLGLGCCWFSAPGFCKETVRQVLKIPRTVEPEAFIILGYPAEKPPVPPRKSLSEFCFTDKWGRDFKI